MHADGVPFTEIHRRLGLSRNTVACWLYRRRGGGLDREAARCPICARPARTVDDAPAYAYLLGQYPGDGHLLMTQRVPLLTVMCDLRYPGVIHEVGRAMTAVGARSVGFQERVGCIGVRSHWMHWPCLFPQHGRGKKHERRIALEEWQQTLAERQAGKFARGLFHSDGSRFVNRVQRGWQDLQLSPLHVCQ
jgi:hypothetical protein